MSSILKSFQSLNPVRSVPIGAVVDWSNPLTNGLVACYLPGVSAGVNMVGIGGDLASSSATAFGVTPEGPGFLSTVNNSAFGGVCPSAVQAITTGGTIFWSGMRLGNSNSANTCSYITISFGTGQFSPFTIIGLMAQSNSLNVFPQWNHGGTPVNGTFSSVAANTQLHLASTFSVGGNVLTYNEGIQISSDAFGAGAPTTDPTDNIRIGDAGSIVASNDFLNGTTNIACIWTRVLSSDEVLQMTLSPYLFLSPKESDLPASFLGAPPPAVAPTLMSQCWM